MKKITPTVILYLLTGIAGIGLIIAGFVYLIALLFVPLPIINGIILLALGAGLLSVFKNYLILVNMRNDLEEMLKKVDNAITSIKSNLSPQNGTSPHNIPPNNYPFNTIESLYKDLFGDDFKGLKKNIITISENTTPEEIQKLKESLPGFDEQINNLIKKVRTTSDKTPLANMSLKELNDELSNAIMEDKFEEASKIKDEIEKRKV
jgi:hypothetical protein